MKAVDVTLDYAPRLHEFVNAFRGTGLSFQWPIGNTHFPGCRYLAASEDRLWILSRLAKRLLCSIFLQR